MLGSLKFIISKLKDINLFDKFFSIINSIESYKHISFEKKPYKERVKVVQQLHNPIHKNKTLEKLNFKQIKK